MGGPPRRGRREPYPVTGKGVRIGEGIGAGLGGTAVGLVLVGVPAGLVLVDVAVGPGLGATAVGLVLVGIPVGPVLVGVPVGPVLVGVPVGGVLVAQLGTLMVSSSRVTAPLRASARPVMVSPVSTVIEVKARMVPWKAVPVLSVAELPTCQKTLQAWAPLVRTTELPAGSVRSVEGAWKIQTASGLPPAFRVSAPETSSDDEALYTPGTSCALSMPAEPMVLGTLAVGLRPAAALYAMVKSAWAPSATVPGPVAVYTVPVTAPGGNPVTAVPGYKPRFPPMTLGPVFVTVLPARTPKLAAVPRPTGAVAANAGCMERNRAAAPATTTPAASGDAASQA